MTFQTHFSHGSKENPSDDSDSTLNASDVEDSSDSSPTSSGGVVEYQMQGEPEDSSSESEYGMLYSSQLQTITEEDSDQLSSSGRSRSSRSGESKENTDIDSSAEDPGPYIPFGSPSRTIINTARPLIIGPYTDRSSRFSRDNIILVDPLSPGSDDETPVSEQLPDWMRAYATRSTHRAYPIDRTPDGAPSLPSPQRPLEESSLADKNQSFLSGSPTAEQIVADSKISKPLSAQSFDTEHEDYPAKQEENIENTDVPLVGTVSKIRQQFETGNFTPESDNHESEKKTGDSNTEQYIFTVNRSEHNASEISHVDKEQKTIQKEISLEDLPANRDNTMTNKFDIASLTLDSDTTDTKSLRADKSLSERSSVIQDNAMSLGAHRLTESQDPHLGSRMTLDLTANTTSASSGDISQDIRVNQLSTSDKTPGGSEKPRRHPALDSPPPWRSIRASTSPTYKDSPLSSPSDARPPRGFIFVEKTSEQTEFSIRTKNLSRPDRLAKSMSESQLYWGTATMSLPSDRHSWGPESFSSLGSDVTWHRSTDNVSEARPRAMPRPSIQRKPLSELLADKEQDTTLGKSDLPLYGTADQVSGVTYQPRIDSSLDQSRDSTLLGLHGENNGLDERLEEAGKRVGQVSLNNVTYRPLTIQTGDDRGTGFLNDIGSNKTPKNDLEKGQSKGLQSPSSWSLSPGQTSQRSPGAPLSPNDPGRPLHPTVQGAPYSEYIRQVKGVRGHQPAAVPRPAAVVSYPSLQLSRHQTVTASATSTALARRSNDNR